MKKFYIKDGLQIMAAILLTGSMAFAMQPAQEPSVASHEAPETTIEQKQENVAPKQLNATTAPETKPEKPKTWRDNPNKCDEKTQWIAKEEPFKCIDKQAKSVLPAETSPKRVSVNGSCADWISAAGITDIANANELISRESGCNPYAVNPSSGACGVAQELPCGKSGCSLGDGACQVKWMNSYVLGRYGSWANAVSFHNANNWY